MKTVRVRIAVAVSPDGRWYAQGGSVYDDRSARSDSLIFHPDQATPDGAFCVSWIEADVPMPIEQPEDTIQGEVKP